MTRTGIAAVVRALDGVFRVEQVEFSEPEGTEVLVEVAAAGLCHSDLNVASVDRGRALPLVAGHELAGTVVAVGPGVTSLRTGDRVVGTEVRTCGRCLPCREGRPTLCAAPGALERPAGASPRIRSGEGSGRGTAVHTLGTSAFATYSLADERQFAVIPDEMPFAQASLLGCGVATGVGAVLNVARVRPGESVAVFGLGGVGLNVVSGAVLAGATTIVAVDVDRDKLELAGRLGATHLVDGSVPDPAREVAAVAPGGVDHAFDAVGAVQATIATIRSTCRGGAAYLIGIPRPGALLELDTMRDMIGHQRSLRGVYMGGTNPARDIPLYARMYLDGRLPLDDLISERIHLREINRAYAAPPAHGARAVIEGFA
ncbi:alcohol dehydrogenase catalytic domain-containing protein [Microbacterium album]|uniref:Alcohol dehydrogenase n=1 Tax=Microbacterium album TaxID=2053191 RepID=A0A917IF47_9MICO|nr:alcohol dehydrogenase catalytic domain-containing protein [Microbacterium album]GGH42322.1 alcohol dehydrogenase [Microbacterium album]